MDLGLADKVLLVTGGSRGLGFATARALVGEGARVVLAARDEERVTAAAAELGCTGVVADLGDPQAAERLVSSCLSAYGRLDGALVSVGGLAASNGLRPGLAMLAKTMADELGPRNVRVNGLMPGRVDTDRVRELDGPDAAVRAGHEANI